MYFIKYYQDKALVSAIAIWIIATSSYFIFDSLGFKLAPIAEDGY
tara:strand:- start:1 stop:135 length:135 start_codon:yes stop_codon:yes gene_type:complete